MEDGALEISPFVLARTGGGTFLYVTHSQITGCLDSFGFR